MSRIGALDMRCVMDITEDCEGCGKCDDLTPICCMDSLKECDGCLNC